MKTQQDLIELAHQAIADLGGPGAMNVDNAAALVFFLRTVAPSDPAAFHAYAAAMAQAQAEAEGLDTHIDLDRCTAYMVALRGPTGQTTRFVPLSSIELIVSAAMQPAQNTNSPFAAPNDNNTTKTVH